ncbi:MAG TPA: hypothetical protein VFT95_05705 [Micromonosporaceae bacterium]|nr:hypothetical protein [Micromonosporaceae bacterium]
MTTTQRRSPILLSLAGLALALALAACGGQAADDGIARAEPGADRPSPTPTEQLSDEERRLKFAECMRGQGVDMEDPGDGKGGVMFRAGGGAGEKPVDIEKAMQACRQYAPNGGEAPKLDPAQVEQMRKFAKCMRSNGVPDFPDPEPDGRMRVAIKGDAIDRAAFEAAQEKCRQFQPEFGRGRRK